MTPISESLRAAFFVYDEILEDQSSYRRSIWNEERRRKASERITGKNNPFFGISRSGRDNPFFGKRHSEKTREIISGKAKGRYIGTKSVWYGRHHTPATRLKMSIRIRAFYAGGGTPPRLGTHFSDESKKRLSESRKRFYANGGKHPMKGRTGERHPFYGKTLSESWKENIRKSRIHGHKDLSRRHILHYKFLWRWLFLRIRT